MKRKLRKLKPKPKFLILCEGSVTERVYLEGLRIQFSLQKELFDVRYGVGVPKTIVDIAASLKKKNKREAKSNPLMAYTEVWCVFDRDAFDLVAEALQQAKDNNICLAFSNPNFELFLLLHFEDCNRGCHRHEQSRMLAKYIKDYEKSFDYSVVQPGFEKARERAGAINARAQIEGGIPAAPYTTVPNLIQSLKDHLLASTSP